jgi:hypothetical protein
VVCANADARRNFDLQKIAEEAPEGQIGSDRMF